MLAGRRGHRHADRRHHARQGHETIQIEGIPLNIIDTAGIRSAGDTIDAVERIGIERTWGEIGKADDPAPA